MLKQDDLTRGIFSIKLKLYRLQQELTQNQLSALSLVPSQVISHYESGHRTPNICALARLAMALDVSVDSLLGLDD